MTAAVFFGGVLGELNKAIPIGKSLRIYFENMEKQYNEAIRAILLFRNVGDYLITLLVIAVVPAIVEEVLFRGGMQQILIRWFSCLIGRGANGRNFCCAPMGRWRRRGRSAAWVWRSLGRG